MTGRLEVDPEALVRAGVSLGQLAEEMASGLSRLQATVSGSDNPWGGDEQGTLFAQLYALVLGKALESLASYVDQIGYAGAGLVEQARADVQTDTASAERFRSLS